MLFEWVWKNIFVVVTVIVYLLAIYNVVRIVNQDREPQSALAWIVVNLVIPFIGVPLYFFLGENRLRGFVKRRQRSQMELDAFRRYRENMPKYSEVMRIEPQSTLDVFGRLVKNRTDVFQPMPGGIKLLINGEETFRQIFATIKQARHYIFVQYYIIRSDRLGVELRDLLIAKAREGVAVYLLIDDIGSFFLADSYLRPLRQAGVHVAKFLPFRIPYQFQVNFRNHRKLVLVDGREAFTGGLNVGMEYVGKQKIGFWRDTHVHISGPAVQALQHVFLDDWYFAAKRSIKLDPLQIRAPEAHVTGEHLHMCAVQTVPFGPSDPFHVGVMLFMQIIQMAKKNLWIASPYFVPDSALERLLELAARRGVDVRLLIPEKPDHLFVHAVTMNYAQRLLRQGIRVFMYQKGFMHQKVIQMDGELAVLGTSNFDNRSMYLNFETALLVHDRTMATETMAMLEADFADSIELQPSHENDSLWHNFPMKLVRLLAPLL